MQAKNQISIRKKTRKDGRYIIKIEGNIVWEGEKPQTRLPGLLKEYRSEDIRISWKSKSGSLID